MLKLNEEKTEFIIFGTHQQLKKNSKHYYQDRQHKYYTS